MMTIIKTPPSPLCSFLYALSSLLEAHKGIFMGSTKGKDDSAQRPLKKKPLFEAQHSCSTEPSGNLIEKKDPNFDFLKSYMNPCLVKALS